MDCDGARANGAGAKNAGDAACAERPSNQTTDCCGDGKNGDGCCAGRSNGDAFYALPRVLLYRQRFGAHFCVRGSRAGGANGED